MIFDRLRRRRATRRRDRVIAGLLQSVYWQVTTGLFDVKLEQRAGETEEQHAARELVAANEHARSALIAIGLMVRNELAARDLLVTVEPTEEASTVLRAAGGTVATLKRTIPGRPE